MAPLPLWAYCAFRNKQSRLKVAYALSKRQVKREESTVISESKMSRVLLAPAELALPARAHPGFLTLDAANAASKRGMDKANKTRHETYRTVYVDR